MVVIIVIDVADILLNQLKQENKQNPHIVISFLLFTINF